MSFHAEKYHLWGYLVSIVVSREGCHFEVAVVNLQIFPGVLSFISFDPYLLALFDSGRSPLVVFSDSPVKSVMVGVGDWIPFNCDPLNTSHQFKPTSHFLRSCFLLISPIDFLFIFFTILFKSNHLLLYKGIYFDKLLQPFELQHIHHFPFRDA